jgi:hypothetical protein
MLYSFNATCFGSYQAHKTSKKNYYVKYIVLFYIIYMYLLSFGAESFVFQFVIKI